MGWIEEMFEPGFDKKYDTCSHCNGYGSSLKESSSTCTRCGGSGLVEKQTTTEGGDQDAEPVQTVP